MAQSKTSRALILGTALLGVSAAQFAAADSNPFGATQLPGGYDLRSMQSEGKCGEGKCGGEKGAKGAEGKCGEGKCGEDKGAKSAEGKCGEGKCGGEKGAKAAEGKCGEGKCGGA